MRITSMDINNKEFKRALRGYNVDEVDDFLEKLAEDYEMVYRENSTIKEKLSIIQDKVNHYSNIENTIQNTLVLAQNAAEQAKISAQREAELIVRNANDSAKRILDKAQSDVIEINDEYDKTKQEFTKFRTKFRNFMVSQFDMFESLEKDFIKNYSIGNSVEDTIKEKDIETELKNFNFKDTNQLEIKDEDLNEIKSFFVNE